MMFPLRRLAKTRSNYVRAFCTSTTAKQSSNTTANTPSTNKFVESAVNMCANDGHTWNCHRNESIDPNTVVFETFYGQSCMLTALNSNDLNNSGTTTDNENYTKCVTSIVNSRIEAANDEDLDLTQVLIGNITEDIKNNLINDTRYGNAEKTVNLTTQVVFDKNNLTEFENRINLDKLKTKVMDFNYQDKSDIELEFFSQVQDSKYEFVMRKLNVNDVSDVASLNKYSLYGNEFDFYLENCLTYKNLPHFGVYKVLPPTSIFAARLGLIGCAFVHCANLSIGGIAVHPKYRQHGIGKALVYQCVKELFDNNIYNNGINICYSHFMEGNNEAKDFFNKLGWKENNKPHYWLRIGYDAHITY